LHEHESTNPISIYGPISERISEIIVCA